MALTYERFAGTFVQAAPLLGIPVWAARIYAIDAAPHADYDAMGTFFLSGLFMLGAGALVAALARFTSRFPSVRALAAGALRFQLWAAAACAIVGAVVVMLALSDKGAPTLQHQPQGFMFGMYLAGFSFGVVLPLVEAGRAIVLAIRALWPGDATGGAP